MFFCPAKMVSLNCISINKLNILASTLPNKTSSPSIPSLPTSNIAPSVPSPPQTLPKLQTQQASPKQKKIKKTSIMEMEKAIGAGNFRDSDPMRDSGENETLFDTTFSKSPGKNEGRVEKQLRETGEWITDRTERKFRSAGKPILMFVIQWILPMWILAFCIASGIIKLPFNSDWVDDLIM